MKLYIGNKNYSSWSMRPWVLMKHFEIPFEEVKVRFDSFEPDSQFKRTINAVSPTGTVPVLVEDDGFAVWDTLAIAEYLADTFAQHPLWPRDRRHRARARSLCAEMHSGFRNLRNHCGMNIEASLPEVGAKLLADETSGVRADLDRLFAAWTDALKASNGPFLFGGFGIVDAYFAPVCSRLTTYGLPMPEVIGSYVKRVLGSPGVAAWVRDALAERDFLPFEENYRTQG